MLPTEAARRKFSQWRTASRILIYDADSSTIQEGSNILGLLRKFRAEGSQPAPVNEFGSSAAAADPDAMIVERELAWLKGGFQAVWRERRELIDSDPPPDEDELDEDQESPPLSISAVPPPSAISLSGSSGSKAHSGSSSEASFRSALSLPSSLGSSQSRTSNSSVLRTKRLPMSAFGVSSTTSSQRSGTAHHHRQYLGDRDSTTASNKAKISPTTAAASASTSNVAYNPFFDAIRQNLELSHGITEKIPLKISKDAKERVGELPFAWLREIGRWASAEDKSPPGSAHPASSSLSFGVEAKVKVQERWREGSSALASTSASSSESGGKDRERENSKEEAHVRFEGQGEDPLGQNVSPNMDEGMEALAMQFYRIELGEQRRLMGVMEHHSKESGLVVKEEESVQGQQQQQQGTRRGKRKGKKLHEEGDEKLEDAGGEGGEGGKLAEGERQKEKEKEQEQGAFPFSITAGIEKGTKNRCVIWLIDRSCLRMCVSRSYSRIVSVVGFRYGYQ